MPSPIFLKSTPTKKTLHFDSEECLCQRNTVVSREKNYCKFFFRGKKKLEITINEMKKEKKSQSNSKTNISIFSKALSLYPKMHECVIKKFCHLKKKTKQVQEKRK